MALKKNLVKAKKKPEIKQKQTVAVDTPTGILNADVNYFKGLSIFLLVLLLVIFLTFSALFGFMYQEAKLLRLQLEQRCTVDLLSADNFEKDSAILPIAGVNTTSWNSFSKYGFEVIFPEDWSFLDKPYEKQVHFFVDGETREIGSSDQGEFFIKMEQTDTLAKAGIQSMEISVGDLTAKNYIQTLDDDIYQVVVVPGNTGFYEMYFLQNPEFEIDNKIFEAIIENFKVL